MLFNECEGANMKKRFYAIASKAEWTDRYAKARFVAEPYHLTELKMRKEVMQDGRNKQAE